jgi:hypothetical protein
MCSLARRAVFFCSFRVCVFCSLDNASQKVEFVKRVSPRYDRIHEDRKRIRILYALSQQNWREDSISKHMTPDSC